MPLDTLIRVCDNKIMKTEVTRAEYNRIARATARINGEMLRRYDLLIDVEARGRSTTFCETLRAENTRDAQRYDELILNFVRKVQATSGEAVRVRLDELINTHGTSNHLLAVAWQFVQHPETAHA